MVPPLATPENSEVHYIMGKGRGGSYVRYVRGGGLRLRRTCRATPGFGSSGAAQGLRGAVGILAGKTPTLCQPIWKSGADDGVRTRDPELGRLMLYQLSYVRLSRPSYRALPRRRKSQSSSQASSKSRRGDLGKRPAGSPYPRLQRKLDFHPR